MSGRNAINSSRLGLLLLLLSLVATESIRLSFGKKEYTPLVFFKVPPGLIPECDAMEECVSQVEKELGVRVERVDIARDPSAEAALAMLTQRTPPFLYNRESCQVVSTSARPGEKIDPNMAVAIDEDRVRAWAKGRFLPPKKSGAKIGAPVVLTQDDKGMDQDELLEDMSMTPEQRKGKEAIKERTEKKAKQRADK
jgi:hypothetical protein